MIAQALKPGDMLLLPSGEIIVLRKANGDNWYARYQELNNTPEGGIEFTNQWLRKWCTLL